MKPANLIALEKPLPPGTQRQTNYEDTWVDSKQKQRKALIEMANRQQRFEHVSSTAHVSRYFNSTLADYHGNLQIMRKPVVIGCNPQTKYHAKVHNSQPTCNHQI